MSEARRDLRRLEPAEARVALEDGTALLIDIRSESQRAEDGYIPGARWVPRNVLEWWLDPSSDHRDPTLARREKIVVLLCDEGYQSSLAPAVVRRFGLEATDVIGGFRAWSGSGEQVTSSQSSTEPRLAPARTACHLRCNRAFGGL